MTRSGSLCVADRRIFPLRNLIGLQEEIVTLLIFKPGLKFWSRTGLTV